MIIAVDVDGGDYAPKEIIKGALKAAQEYKIGLILLGKKEVIHVHAGHYLKKYPIEIVHCPQTITFNEHAVEAIKGKPKSAIVIGTSLVKQGKADAFISAGNTGAVLAATFFILGKIDGVERPALGAIITTRPHIPSLLIDAGANAECRPNHLDEFAHLGNIYAKQVLGLEKPRIGLLNNGEEEAKGTKLTLETHQLLKKSQLNFIGNIEGHDISLNKADVIVTDGFTGNVVLKTLEGLGDALLKLRKVGHAIDSAAHLRGRALLADVGLGSMVKGMDFEECGGACLLGVKGTVIVAHGRSHARAIKNAIGLAKRTAEKGVDKLIAEDVRLRTLTATEGEQNHVTTPV